MHGLLFPISGLYQRLLFALLLMGFSGCNIDAVQEPANQRTAKALVFEWNKLLLELERHTPGYRGPVAARSYAYIGIAAWQAALPGLEGCNSLERQFPEMTNFPKAPAAFFMPASLNVAYAEILRQFFPTAPAHLQEKILALEAGQADALRRQTEPDIFRQSVSYGKRVAFEVWRWSMSDTLGHDGFLYNFDRLYVPPACAGCWQPGGEHPMPALLPFWGGVRKFVATSNAIAVKAPVSFDETPGTSFYAEGMAVYTMSQPLSKENQWIAEFWSDDVPGLTQSPAGRWISIATQAMEQAGLPLPEVLETYLKLGFSLSDALVVCWEAKYRYALQRPDSYIRAVIDPNWKPLHDSPNFPTYPSGHSALGMAAAEVLTARLGANFSLTDRTHEGRKEFAGQPRSFTSFEQMALENAFSRMALGVHFPMDCEEGIRIGRLVARAVNTLPLHTDEAGLR
ncbi:MAG: vanadium-dependent haloperoxidase [Saprospiraceae bacterium]|nr:vanadium-dependent haloperoxidase [Saprospiraceae bacterium]